MADLKLFEVRLKWFICAETKERAEEELLKVFGAQSASMELKESKAGFVAVCPEQKREPIKELPEPELGLDEVPF